MYKFRVGDKVRIVSPAYLPQYSGIYKIKQINKATVLPEKRLWINLGNVSVGFYPDELMFVGLECMQYYD